MTTPAESRRRGRPKNPVQSAAGRLGRLTSLYPPDAPEVVEAEKALGYELIRRSITDLTGTYPRLDAEQIESLVSLLRGE